LLARDRYCHNAHREMIKLFVTWPDTRSGIASVDEMGGYFK
jgi:hypothetical protein